MIQEIKQKVGQEAERIIAGGIPLQKSNNKYRCPNIVQHKNQDKHPSMSWDPNALQFYCFTCNEKIDIYEYYKTYEGLDHQQILTKLNLKNNPSKPVAAASCKSDSIKPDFTYGPLNDNQVEYLLKRKISKETQDYFKFGNIKGNISIPYYDNNQITGIKVKNLSKGTGDKYISVTGSKFGLFNKQNANDHTRPLIITEGEFDAAIVHQCGFSNVVSVGTGANSISKLFRQEKAFLDRFSALIVIGDNDDPGNKMEEAFVQEFGLKVKLSNKSIFSGCKDINEIYYRFGQEQVCEVINSSDMKIKGLRNLDNYPYTGLELTKGKYIPTGLKSIDHAINDLAPGVLTLITGRSNGGKSTLVNQIIANAIDVESKVFLVSGEGMQDLTINNLYKAIIGRNEELYILKKINKRFFKEPNPEVLEDLRLWHKSKLFLFNKGESDFKTTDELFELLELSIKSYKLDLVIIDNLMSILSVEKAAEKLEKQADFLQRCLYMAKAEKIHIIVVLHPNKTVVKGADMEFEQISGTLDLSNKADNIISVKREYSQLIDNGIDGQIELLKNRYFDNMIKINVHFDRETGMLYEIDKESGNYLAPAFKWRQGIKREKEVGIEQREQRRLYYWEE